MATSSESPTDDVITDKEEPEQNPDDYRWAWSQTGTFAIDFVKIDGGKATVKGDFSRAFIKDRDLLKASRRPLEDPSEAVKELQMDLEDVSLKSAAGDAENAQTLEEEDKDSAFSVLPKPAKKSRKQDKKKKSKNYHYRSFDEFWDVTSYWLLNSTWRWDFGHHMAAENLAELDQQLTTMKPMFLIEKHMDLKENPDYHQITAKCIEQQPGVSFETVYEKHCELIKKQAEQDFHAHQTKAITRRCKDMMDRVQRLGYTPGFDDSQFPLNYDLSKTQEQREKAVIRDVRYTIDESYNKTFRDDLRDDEKALTSEPAEPAPTAPEAPKNPADMRFHFDPETEQHLIASNAEKLYANDPEIRKYYYQRYRLFSRLDEGVIMDREGWFSVTPEAIAEHIADRVVRHGIHVVVDAFTGVGGNAIQFALKGAHVIAIDMDPVRLKCARQNAVIYGVDDYIHFICADFFDVAATWQADKARAPEVDAVFLSPPWGGPSYLNSAEFDLETGCTPNGVDIFDVSLKISPNIAYFLPRNTKVSQLTELAMKAKTRMEIEQSALNNKVKTITVYYGKLAYHEKKSN